MRFSHFAPAVLIAFSLAARADTLLYTFGPAYPNEPTHTFSFELPSNPTPDQLIVTLTTTEHDLAVRSVPVTADNVPGTYLVVFNLDDGGGLVLSPYTYSSSEPTFSYQAVNDGPFFSGEPNAPTFLPGTFTLRELGAPYGGALGTLTVTDLTTAATPEPSSFALLGTGLLGVVGVVRRRLA